MSMRTLCLGTLLVLCACAVSDGPAQKAPTSGAVPAAKRSTRRQPPLLRAQLQGPTAPKAGEVLELRLVLDRSSAFTAPARVQFHLPPGVMHYGDRRKRLARQGDRIASGVHERIYRFHLSGIPERDLVLEIDARGAAAGYHAKLRYGFGRKDAAPVGPIRTGAPVRVAGKNFGPAVQVSRSNSDSRRALSSDTD